MAATGAVETYVYDESFIDSSGDLQTKQFYIVKLDTATQGGVLLAAAASDQIIGVLQNKPGTGSISGVNHAAVVRILGISKVIAGGTVAVGDWLTSDANGKAVATTTAGDYVIGRSLNAGSSGDIISVLMTGVHSED